MTELHDLTRRRFLSAAGAASGAALLGSSDMIRPARAQGAFPAMGEEDLVIAFGHVGPISDEGWTWQHNQGLLAVKEAFPNVEIIEVETVPYSADATRIFRRFISEGANMVMITSEYGDLLSEVSDRAPEVAFMECNGHHTTDNMSLYYIQHWMPTYVLGVAAGMMSPTGNLGYVGSYAVPAVYGSANAFQLGAKSVNPDAKTQVILINSWFDPQAATQAANALIDNGSDFLFGIMDEAAYLQVAESRGVPAAMWNTDVRRYGPESYVTSIIPDWRKFYVEQVGARLAGNWQPHQELLLPLGDGIDIDAWGQNVPEDVRAAADAVREQMLGGFNPFVGEIRDKSGAVRIAAGESYDAFQAYYWDWSVEGVSGMPD